MTVFAYLRVSTENKGQTTDNQRKLLADGDFNINEYHSEDGVSGSTNAADRPVFKAMLKRMKAGDTLVVTMIDRLGRSASDILNVVEMFKRMDVRVRVIQFDSLDITSSMGKMVLTCMAAMAEMERNLLIERVQAGLERTKEQGTKLGPPLTISPDVMQQLITRKADGETYDMLTNRYGIPRNTVARNITKWKGKMDEYKTEWEAREKQYAMKG